MQNDDWGGYAGHHDSRYTQPYQHPQAQPQPGAYAGQYGAPGPYAAPPQPMPGHDPMHPYPPEAEAEWQQPAQGGASGVGVGRVLHGAGALLSVALIAGLGVWGYQLAMRDVTGVPVVRALEGPMRIQPDDPGGVAAAHQGLAVNNIAAAGQAEGPAAQVALAPAPAALEAEDQPAHDVAEVSAVSMAEAGDAPLAEAPALDPQAASLTDAEQDNVEAVMAMANAISATAQPLSGEQTAPATAPEAELQLAAAVIPANVPGVTRSPRPQRRPEDVVARAATSAVELAVASAVAATGPSVTEVAASEIAIGTRLVQLGAFDSEAGARSEWDEVALRFPEMLEGKDRVIEQAQSGGKTFYRLRAMGFEDLSDARRFCAALMAGQAACIPVVTR